MLCVCEVCVLWLLAALAKQRAVSASKCSSVSTTLDCRAARIFEEHLGEPDETRNLPVHRSFNPGLSPSSFFASLWNLPLRSSRSLAQSDGTPASASISPTDLFSRLPFPPLSAPHQAHRNPCLLWGFGNCHASGLPRPSFRHVERPLYYLLYAPPTLPRRFLLWCIASRILPIPPAVLGTASRRLRLYPRCSPATFAHLHPALVDFVSHSPWHSTCLVLDRPSNLVASLAPSQTPGPTPAPGAPAPKVETTPVFDRGSGNRRHCVPLRRRTPGKQTTHRRVGNVWSPNDLAFRAATSVKTDSTTTIG